MGGSQSEDALKVNASRRVGTAVPNTPPESPVTMNKHRPPTKSKDADKKSAKIPMELKSVDYWFHDGNLLLTCDDLWFFVHQSVLSRLSPKFKDAITKFRVPDIPVVRMKVPGNAKSWAVFLSMVYPSNTGEERARLTQEEWFLIYDVARDYGFEGIRRVAFAEITLNVDKFIDLVKMGRNQFSTVPEWCVQGYKGLCFRDAPLTLEEAKELGIEDTVKIAEARESLLRGSTWENIMERFMWSI